jgi:hypothetical protein
MNRSIVSGLFATVIALTLISQASALSPAQRAVNEKEAVLVGFRIHDSAADPKIQVSAYRYETWLIVRDHSDVVVAAKLTTSCRARAASGELACSVFVKSRPG